MSPQVLGIIIGAVVGLLAGWLFFRSDEKGRRTGVLATLIFAVAGGFIGFFVVQMT